MIHYGTLICKCDVEGCSIVETFDNPRHYDSRTLTLKAILKGWYLPWNGQQRCPKHHKEVADKAGLQSMYSFPAINQDMKKELDRLSILEGIPAPPTQ